MRDLDTPEVADLVFLQDSYIDVQRRYFVALRAWEEDHPGESAYTAMRNYREGR